MHPAAHAKINLLNGDPLFLKILSFNCFLSFLGNRYIVETDGLLIKHVEQEDAGTYTCRARVLETGSMEERDIKLEVSL